MVRAAEAAYRAQIAYGTVLRLVTQGIVKGRRDGSGKWWADSADLARWKAQKQEAMQERVHAPAGA